MAKIIGNVFTYTTYVSDKRIHTALALFKNNELDNEHSNITKEQLNDALARSVELNYIDGLSVNRTITREIFLVNCHITKKGQEFLDNFKCEQEI